MRKQSTDALKLWGGGAGDVQVLWSHTLLRSGMVEPS